MERQLRDTKAQQATPLIPCVRSCMNTPNISYFAITPLSASDIPVFVINAHGKLETLTEQGKWSNRVFDNLHGLSW